MMVGGFCGGTLGISVGLFCLTLFRTFPNSEASCVEAWVEYHRRSSFQGATVGSDLPNVYMMELVGGRNFGRAIGIRLDLWIWVPFWENLVGLQ